MVGSGFPYSEFLPKEGQARGVQIDIEPDMLSLRYPMEVNLLGDSAETLRALLPLLRAKTDRRWRERIEKGVADWWSTLESARSSRREPLNPQRVSWELSPRLPDARSSPAIPDRAPTGIARDLKVRRGMMCSLSGGLASMGAAVPYAIAAKFAHPERPVIALVGDGAMQMNNMAELITVAKYWREWTNPRWSCCVFNNQDLNQVTWEQRVMEGDPKFEATQNIPERALPPLRRADRPEGHLRRRSRSRGRRWDEALSRRSAGGDGGQDGPRGAAAAAAYHASSRRRILPGR